ncbi:MAG: hypothetical protein IJ295_02730 [Clostridia bacterium]|nr:hypothetical protein [Clostridia bacterium]
MEKDLYEKWSSLADNNYYKDHRRVIDRLGLIKPSMFMTEPMLQKLKKEITDKKFTFECLLFDAVQTLANVSLTRNTVFGQALQK